MHQTPSGRVQTYRLKPQTIGGGEAWRCQKNVRGLSLSMRRKSLRVEWHYDTALNCKGRGRPPKYADEGHVYILSLLFQPRSAHDPVQQVCMCNHNPWTLPGLSWCFIGLLSSLEWFHDMIALCATRTTDQPGRVFRRRAVVPCTVSTHDRCLK